MKIFSWMQNKLNGRQKPNKIGIGSLQVADQEVKEAKKEDVMVWPNGLLTIGTFGINNLKNPPNSPRKDNLDLDDDFDIIPIDDQVKEFLSLQKGTSLPPENFLAILRDLQDGSSSSESNGENSSSKDVQSYKDSNHLDKKKSIRKRALQFLLRKSFLGGGKPMLNPIVKDPLDLKLDKSRMEKILRTILHKQVHPQGSTTNSSARKCLDMKHVTYNECEEETLEEEEEKEKEEEEEEGCKWVKTDSEYIVLEI